MVMVVMLIDHNHRFLLLNHRILDDVQAPPVVVMGTGVHHGNHVLFLVMLHFSVKRHLVLPFSFVGRICFLVDGKLEAVVITVQNGGSFSSVLQLFLFKLCVRRYDWSSLGQRFVVKVGRVAMVLFVVMGFHVLKLTLLYGYVDELSN